MPVLSQKELAEEFRKEINAIRDSRIRNGVLCDYGTDTPSVGFPEEFDDDWIPPDTKWNPNKKPFLPGTVIFTRENES